MLKLYEEQKNSIYDLQKIVGCGKDTLYKYARRERDIKNMSIDYILKIANAEKIEPNVLFKRMEEYLSKIEKSDK